MKKLLLPLLLSLTFFLCSCQGKILSDSGLKEATPGESEGAEAVVLDMKDPDVPDLECLAGRGGYSIFKCHFAPQNTVIPETYDDGVHGELPILYIYSDAFSGSKNLQRLTIPYTVKGIEQDAFKNCPNLQEVIFSEQAELEYIAKDAFSSCVSLKKVVLPDSLVYLDMAFDGCTSLTEVVMPFIGNIKTVTWQIEGETVVFEWREGSLATHFGSSVSSIKKVTVTGGRMESYDMSKINITLTDASLTLPADMTALPTLQLDGEYFLFVQRGGLFRSENNCIYDKDNVLVFPAEREEE